MFINFFALPGRENVKGGIPRLSGTVRVRLVLRIT
jgi:hypothetical protein